MAPWPVVLASVLQFATALAFVAMALLAYRYGSDAQAAAEAEVARQGDPPHLLDRARVNVRESGAELALPLGIALALAVLGTLNLAGSGTARVATWTFQPPLLVAGGFVTAGQVFAVRFVRSAFLKSGDQDLKLMNVERFMEAATSEFPAVVPLPGRTSLCPCDRWVGGRRDPAGPALGEYLLPIEKDPGGS